jgi:hypothetical protein
MGAWIHILVWRVVQRQRNIIIMDDNYTRNGSNNANGFQIDRYFWIHAVNTTFQIQNRVMLRKNNEKTPYYLWKGRPANVKHFRVFGSKCYIKREYGKMGKFDSCVDKGVLVGYSSTMKSYKCCNPRLKNFVENINVKIDETSG